jgi:hypothetical protein
MQAFTAVASVTVATVIAKQASAQAAACCFPSAKMS